MQRGKVDVSLGQAFLVVGIIWVLWLLAVVSLSIIDLPAMIGDRATPNLMAAGQFGDLFGGVNAAFTALAFAAVWWTAKLQRQNQDTIERQLFEARFFQQLTLFSDVATTLRAAGSTTLKASTTGFTSGQRPTLAHVRVNVERRALAASVSELRSRFADAYAKLAPEDLNAIEPFLHTLYYVVHAARSNEKLTAEEQRAYVRVVRGLLGRDELHLLALVGVARTNKEFGIIEYIAPEGLLKHFPVELRSPALVECLGKTAFAIKDDSNLD